MDLPTACLDALMKFFVSICVFYFFGITALATRIHCAFLVGEAPPLKAVQMVQSSYNTIAYFSTAGFTAILFVIIFLDVLNHGKQLKTLWKKIQRRE